jgi:hypothetical protein
MASEDPKMSEQGTASKRKHVTLLFSQKLEIIRRLGSDESQNVFMASHSMESLAVYDTNKQTDQLRFIMPSSESVNGHLKRQTLKQPKLVQLDRALCMLFMAL